MNKKDYLKYIVDNELFITCPLKSSDEFIKYCGERGIRTSRKQLEQFEKLGIFYPLSRIKYPKIKLKVEYLDSSDQYRVLGILEENEKWTGDVREQYVYSGFEKGVAKEWFEKGHLWEPSSRPFQPWETFEDENEDVHIESFYSLFQCYTLYNLIRTTKLEINAGWWASCSNEDISKTTIEISRWANHVITWIQNNKIRGEDVAYICQIISNRYFPRTRSDRRTIQIPRSSDYYDWDWDEYSRKWNAKAVFDEIGCNIEKLNRLYEIVSIDAKFVDPLERWRDLIEFVSLEKKDDLKDEARLACTFYSMAKMLQLFYEDITGNKINQPWEWPKGVKDKFYGEGVMQNELQYLEFLTNQFHLNPRPKLILIVEGDGEAEQIPRLAENLLGYSFPRVGIEVRNIGGIGNFTGRKRIDRYGALERLIDEFHYRQTIVFVILDNEGRASKIKNRLIKAKSKYPPRKMVTKEDYVHIWNKNIEFDNFSDNEIARAMTTLCNEKYGFQPDEIAHYRKSFSPSSGGSLNKLFKAKLNHDFSKPKLLKILFDFILTHPQNEINAKGDTKRPVVRKTKEIIKLASQNYQPSRKETWLRNQQSGHFG